MWSGIYRRKFPRANYKCLVTVRKKLNPQTFTTQTENIGIGGVCVILQKRLDIFSQVDLVLTLQNGLPPVKCEGAVVWTVRRADLKKVKPDSYDTGIEFSNIKPDDRQKIEEIIEKIVKKV